MSKQRFLRAQSDSFVGRRGRLDRYLVCSTQGYFPVLVRTGPAALAAIFRTGGTHVGASATLAIAGSADGGKCWSDPVEITPRWEDARNPAFGVNRRGELIAAFWKATMDAYADGPNGPVYKPDAGDYAEPSTLITHSRDGGRTWSDAVPYRSRHLKLASPYGRIFPAPDGTLLMCIYATPREPIEGVRDVAVLTRSTDDGKTWGDETLVATKHNETSFAFLGDGRLLAAARSESGHVATLFSDDGGRVWSTPQQVTRDGEHPADLTVLTDGRALMTFGRRIRPMGCGALLSGDGGKTWDTTRQVLLAGDGVRDGDLGYPSTVQLADGTIVTALYFASGSEASAGFGGWGEVSCQAIHYRPEDIS